MNSNSKTISVAPVEEQLIRMELWQTTDEQYSLRLTAFTRDGLITRSFESSFNIGHELTTTRLSSLHQIFARILMYYFN